MSDAQRPKNDGEAAEEQADATAPISDDARATGSDADLTRGGPDPDTAVFSAEGANGYGADAADAGSGTPANAGASAPAGTDAGAAASSNAAPAEPASGTGATPSGDSGATPGTHAGATASSNAAPADPAAGTGATPSGGTDSTAAAPGDAGSGSAAAADAGTGSAPAADAGTGSATAAGAGAGYAAGSASTPTSADQRGAATADSASTSEEPDYEALAAELDRLEADTATSAPVAPGAREPEPRDKAADPWFEPSTSDTFTASDPQHTAPHDESHAPAAVAPAATASASHAPIFVQAPEPPRKRGNRGAAGLIGLVAAVVFAVLFAVVNYLWQLFVATVGASDTLGGGHTDLVEFATEVLLAPPFWFTVVAFWLAFWLLGVFVNRARWWSWTVLGLIVAILTYVGEIGGHFLDAPFWKLTGDESLTLLANSLFAPTALLALIVAREVTIWFGAWVSRRGARIAKLNAEEREEYDKVMAEGPKAP